MTETAKTPRPQHAVDDFEKIGAFTAGQNLAKRVPNMSSN